MRIFKITDIGEYNNFKALFVCENCGHSYEGCGYSDDNFNKVVMPNATCPECGLNSFGETYDETKNRCGIGYKID